MADEIPMITPGAEGTWTLPTLMEGAESSITITGRFLGFSSTKRYFHTHEGDRPIEGKRCSACRWMIFRIFRTQMGYVIHYAGMTVVPGETTRCHHTETVTAMEVISVLTTRRPDRVTLSAPADRVLAQASEFDGNLRDAYENRAVL